MHNWELIWKECERLASQCSNVTELSKRLDIPRTTLTGKMREEGITFASFLVAGNEGKATAINKLSLQNTALKREIKYLNDRMGRNAWWSDTVVQAAAMLKRESLPVPIKNISPNTSQTALLQLSDVHIGQNTPAEEVGVFGEYNSNIAKARFNATFQKFTGIVKQQPFPVNEVVVWLGGDIVEHSHLRPGHESIVDMHVIQQTLVATDLLIANLNFLCGKFNKVRVVAVSGNHGRTDSDPRKCGSTDNFDYLIYHIAKRALQNKNIEWDIPETWYSHFRVEGWNFFGMHGEDIRSYVGFPWYGATRAARNYVAMFRLAQKRNLKQNPPTTIEEFQEALIVPDYALLAHFHQKANWEAPDIEIFANGAMPGLSRYSTKRLKTMNTPKQNMMFVHPRYGVGLRCPILLDNIT